jgi:uncharacterized protein YmfQ (DUF2313 family)
VSETLHHQHLLALSPPGAAFPRQADSAWARALQPLAAEHARVEAEAEALLRETDPRDAPRMLEDYERLLGEDPCLGPSADLPPEIRRRVAHQRWTQQGGANPAFFVALAAAIGIEAQVIESLPFEVEVATVDDELIDEAGRYEWFIFIPPPALLTEAGVTVLTEAGQPLRAESATVLTAFEVSVSDVDTAIEDYRPSPLECVARRHAPAHTTLYFAYA